MNYTKQFSLLGILIFLISMLFAYGLDFLWLSAITVALSLLGWIGNLRMRSWYIDTSFIGAGILIIIGVLLGLGVSLLLPATLGALAAWDLARFQLRTQSAMDADKIRTLEKRHFGLLALVLVSGGSLAGVLLSFQVQIPFWITLALGIILIISLGKIYQMFGDLADSRKSSVYD